VMHPQKVFESSVAKVTPVGKHSSLRNCSQSAW